MSTQAVEAQATGSSQLTHQKESRTGKRLVDVPNGVEVQVDGVQVTIKGPKGTATRSLPEQVKVSRVEKQLRVEMQPGSGTVGLQFQGLTRALLHNMIVGVHTGYATYLDLYGVGYRAELSGTELTMALGLSHSVKVQMPKGINARVETIDQAGTKRPRLHLESHDKELLGQVAAKVRSYRPPEPYKGKGIRLKDEKIREKAGKAGGKAGKGAK